jgi:hypothetical protein
MLIPTTYLTSIRLTTSLNSFYGIPTFDTLSLILAPILLESIPLNQIVI